MPTAAAGTDNWFVVDRDYRIVEARTAYGLVEAKIGEILWDAFPGSHDVYQDIYAEAWRRPVETLAFHLGRLVNVNARRAGDRLTVSYRILVELDTVTFRRLAASLDQIEALLAARDSPGSGQASRGSLRLLPVRSPNDR